MSYATTAHGTLYICTCFYFTLQIRTLFSLKATSNDLCSWIGCLLNMRRTCRLNEPRLASFPLLPHFCLYFISRDCKKMEEEAEALWVSPIFQRLALQPCGIMSAVSGGWPGDYFTISFASCRVVKLSLTSFFSHRRETWNVCDVSGWRRSPKGRSTWTNTCRVWSAKQVGHGHTQD